MYTTPRKMIKSVDQFLMVGFGTTRAELSKNYNIARGRLGNHRRREDHPHRSEAEIG